MSIKYRPDIDGLRAIAVLSVVIYHYFPNVLPGGFIGVDIFFIISGFLISTIIFESVEKGTFSFSDFYSRRIKRIFPALLLVFLFCYSFGWFSLLAEEYAQLGRHISAGATFVSNLVLWSEVNYFDNAAETKPLLHLWSLGIEEQFYLFWPLIVIMISKARVSAIKIIIILIVISFSINAYDVKHNVAASFYSPIGRFWELLLGSLLSRFCIYKRDSVAKLHKKIGVNSLSIAGVVILAIGLCMINKNHHFPGWWALLPTISAISLILSTGSAFNTKILSNKVIVWFGLISYPLYLWHWPIASFARIMEGEVPSISIRFSLMLLSILFAWLTYYFVERKVRYSQNSKATVSILISIMAAFGCIGWITNITGGLNDREVVLKNTEKNPVAINSNPASSCDKIKYLDGKYCIEYKASNPKKKVIIWGDSSSGAWSPAFQDVAKRNDFTLISISHPSCPPLLGARKTDFKYPESKDYCSNGLMQKGVLDFIKNQKPDLIFLMAAWNAYSPYSNREFITDGNSADADASSTLRTIKDKVPETIHELSKISKVVVFKPWPILPAEPNYPIKRVEFLQSNLGTVNADAIEFAKDNELIDGVLNNFNDRNIIIFDPSFKTCDSVVCKSLFDGVRVYKDTYHLTPQGAMIFVNDISKLITEN